MATANVQGTCRRQWRQSTRRFSRRLLCCSCLHGVENDPLQQQEKKINRGPQQLHMDKLGSGERGEVKEPIQITVDDLGIFNTSFSLSEEDPLTYRISMACSASTASACQRALKKKRLKPLVSLPLQPQSEPATTTGDDSEEELLFESGTDSTLASGGLLTPPVINLIPPTPSDVVDDDQFFDNNSEESVAHTSGSDGSCVASDLESYDEKIESVEAEQSKQDFIPVGEKADADSAAELKGLSDQFGEDKKALSSREGDEGKAKPRFLQSAYQVAPIPEYRERRTFNTGINLLSFTEHNLDDLSNKDMSCSNMVKTELRLLPNPAIMDRSTHQRRPITRSCSLEETLTRSTTFHALNQTTDQHQDEEELPHRRRITIATYTPQSKDQNGNFPEKNKTQKVAKSIRELNTDEICQWFTNIGLQKCLPYIKEAKLCGADIASVDVNTLDLLHITTLEDREQLLSAIYAELHPPNNIIQRVDSLLGSNNVETVTATLVSMSKSKSSPHVSCLSMNRHSLKLRNNSQSYMVLNNSQVIEIIINASERIVHLRTPKETTVGKVMDSCMKMLGVTEDKCLFMLKEKLGSSEELSPDQQIGSLLTSTSEKTQLELHLCKTEKPTSPTSQNSPEVSSSSKNGNINKNLQENSPAKEERIRELKQQVESLQNVILQVQELHHSLVDFCSELKNMDGDVNIDRLGSAELKQKLELVKGRLNDKRQSLQTLRDNINNSSAHKKKQFDVHLLEKMKLNCQVFKEEISMVHLNRHMAHLQNALEESYFKEEAQKKTLVICSLSQLLSPRSPAMLLVVQENLGSDGHYGFTCRYREGSGLVVVKVDNSHLCVDDRLVEVNGVTVVNSTEDELSDLLLQGPSAQIVVLRQPPPALTSQQHPLLPQHKVRPDPMQTVCPEREVVTMETHPQRKVMAI